MAEGRFWDEPIETGPGPDSSSDFDCIVVGGGPGGSAAASYLAMEGKKVLLLEKRIWPRDKVCGDAVGGKSLSHVKALGVKATLESLAYQTKDLINAMEQDSKVALSTLKVDGGACANNILMQFQADILNAKIENFSRSPRFC